MKFTTVANDAFQKFQLNAGVLLTEFDPSSPTLDRSKIFAATSGGAAFTATPEFIDFGEGIDNMPANTKQLKRIQSVTAVMSGTLKTVDPEVAKFLMAAADADANGKVTPRANLSLDDFSDIWWVGDYSDVNEDGDSETAGFMAIHLMNALNTGGFSVKPNDKGKGDFAFEFTGHYDINDMNLVPYEVYISDGVTTSVAITLSALTISSLSVALSPTFSADTTSYTATASGSSSTVTATETDSDATVAITVNGDSIANEGTATWVDGKNVVKIVVSNGTLSKTYTVNVTASVE